MILHIADAVLSHARPHQPCDETNSGNDDNKQHPEPEEHVDLLIVHVDRQCALDRVAVEVSQSSDIEVTHCDSWERHSRRLMPVISTTHPCHYLQDQVISIIIFIGLFPNILFQRGSAKLEYTLSWFPPVRSHLCFCNA